MEVKKIPAELEKVLAPYLEIHPKLSYPADFGKERLFEITLKEKKNRAPMPSPEEICFFRVAKTFLSILEEKELSDFIESLGYKNFTLIDFGFIPPRGVIGWHTDYTFACPSGKIIEITRNYSEDGFFTYQKNEEIIKLEEPLGYSYKIYELGGVENLFWHGKYGGTEGKYTLKIKLLD